MGWITENGKNKWLYEKDHKDRNWCFTAWEEHQPERPEPQDMKTIKYWVVGREICPETKKVHWQGFISFKNARKPSGVQKLIDKDNWKKVHVEPKLQHSSFDDCRDYCIKDGDAKEWGELPQQGARNDIKNFYEDIKKKRKYLEIADDHTECMAKYLKFYKETKFQVAREDVKFEEIEVNVIVGPAGCGKTRSVVEKHPDVYWVEPTNSGTVWFDGYDGQEAILFDDFYGGVKYSQMLRFLDGYKFQLPIKGGFTWKQWKKVYITSNKHPDQWYKHGLTPALSRRLTNVQILDTEVAR